MSKRTLPTVRAAEGNEAHGAPTRRTMLTALAILPAAGGGAALAMATPASPAAPADATVALAGASSPAPSALRELHRRWSEIER
jgi:hypothetical protein